LLTLVIRGSKIDHQPGDHDDYANAAAGALVLASARSVEPDITDEFINDFRRLCREEKHRQWLHEREWGVSL
jgi:hypothetical protein